MPELTPFFSTGSLVDAVVEAWAPPPRLTCRLSAPILLSIIEVAQEIAGKLRLSPAIADVFMPQDLDYPSLRVDIDRLHAAKLGLTEREVLTNVITSLTSNQMIAPNLWIDPRNGKQLFFDRFNTQKPRNPLYPGSATLFLCTPNGDPPSRLVWV